MTSAASRIPRSGARPRCVASGAGTAALAASITLALAALAAPAAAELRIVDNDDVRFAVSGYVRAVSTVRHLDLGVDAIPAETAAHTDVARVQWRLAIGNHVVVDVHQRLLVAISTPLANPLIGAGLSPAPARRVNLRSDLVERDGLRVNHDLDRLALRIYAGPVDLVIGRQAITWGVSSIFTVSDLWSSFSPFDLDTTEKRGVDAIRATVPMGRRAELEVIVADQGRDDGVAAGARASFYLRSMDVYTAFAKLWDGLFWVSGASLDLGTATLRADVVAPYSLDDAELRRPRATLGLDWLPPDWFFSWELHYGGLGAANASGYIETADSASFRRGEAFLLGRAYVGMVTAWRGAAIWTPSMTLMMNVADPSAIIAPSIQWDIAQDVELQLGTYHGVGGKPELLPPSLRSEFGAYGHTVWIGLAAYY